MFTTNTSNKTNALEWFAIIILAIGGLVSLAAIILFTWNEPMFDHHLNVNSSKFGDIGSFLSGTVGIMWSLASVIYFVLALKVQRREIANNQKSQALQSFETTFFQLVTLHADIVNEIQFERYNKIVRGKMVFNLWKESLDLLASQASIDGEIIGGIPIPFPHEPTNELDVFKSWIEEKYRILYDFEFEAVLSHYFRELYQIFKYIHLSELIEDHQKQFYAELLRAHLSQNELYALAVNCVLPRYGYPKFMYLVKTYDVLKNINYESIPSGILWEYIEDVKLNCPNPF